MAGDRVAGERMVVQFKHLNREACAARLLRGEVKNIWYSLNSSLKRANPRETWRTYSVASFDGAQNDGGISYIIGANIG